MPQMPEKTEYKYGKHKDAVVSLLQSVADFVTDQRTGTLISDPKAAKIALKQGVAPAEVEFSFPWWIRKAKDFQALGVNLPMVTTVRYLRRCEPIRYCEHGIGRLIGGVVKPIVFEEDAVLVFQSTPELKNLMSHGRRLAAAVNETYYGPSEDRTRHLIAEYKTFCESLAAKGEDRIVSTTSPTAAAVVPVPRPLAFQAEGGMTATQKADLFREYLSKVGEMNEGIQNIVSHCATQLLLLTSVYNDFTHSLFPGISSERLKITRPLPPTPKCIFKVLPLPLPMPLLSKLVLPRATATMQLN